jgi:hypothetical protein
VKEAFSPDPTEHVLCAAIWVDTGKSDPPRRTYAYPKTGIVFAGWRHPDCFVAIGAWAELLPPEERDRLKEQIAGRNQGFVTSNGRFVDRAEATQIAILAGQVPPDFGPRDLFSEHLY